MRMQFELDRNDDPGLYDDLVRFKKGTKRINRLRFLAHEGMVAQAVVVGALAGRVVGTPISDSAPPSASGDGVGPKVPSVTLGSFDEALTDE